MIIRLRIIILVYLCILSSPGLAESAKRYQVDIIIFAHQLSSLDLAEKIAAVVPNAQQAIPLKMGGSGFYHMLPTSTSSLQSAFWSLSRRPDYQMIAHYSWLQPSNNQRAVMIDAQSNNGWRTAGTLRIRQSNYYLFDAQLLFTLPGQKSTFLLTQKQRLKPGTVYYLDHPRAGILIKVHQV